MNIKEQFIFLSQEIADKNVLIKTFKIMKINQTQESIGTLVYFEIGL